jgi:hypothetical protein
MWPFDGSNLLHGSQHEEAMQKELDQLRAERDSRPKDPTYQGAYNPATMGMEDAVNAHLAGIDMNTQGLDKFRQEATRTGPSAWASLMKSKGDLEAADAQGKLGRQINAQGARAASQLAMRGGVSTGARERIARQGEQNYLDMGQDTRRQNQINQMQVGVNDESNRIQQLGMLPGMEAQAANFGLDKAKLWGQGRQFDIENQVKEGQSRNQFNMDRYHENMAGWAGNQQANAIAQSGGK